MCMPQTQVYSGLSQTSKMELLVVDYFRKKLYPNVRPGSEYHPRDLWQLYAIYEIK